MANLRNLAILVATGLIGAALAAQAPAPQQVQKHADHKIARGVAKEVKGQREVDRGKAAEHRAGREEAKAATLRQEGKPVAAARVEAKAERTEAKGRAEVRKGRQDKATGRRLVRKGEILKDQPK